MKKYRPQQTFQPFQCKKDPKGLLELIKTHSSEFPKKFKHQEPTGQQKNASP